jgi:hypothetical protein
MMTEQARGKDIDALFRDGRAIDRALKKAVRLALEAHRRAGRSIVVSRNGRVVRIPATALPSPRRNATRTKNR